MKYDLSRKPTKGAARTLQAFAVSMMQTLARESFERISVNELCEQAAYPRATFYNYFDDKYDLLNYCWHFMGEQIRLEEYHKIPCEEMLDVYFARIYELLAARRELICRIFKHNPESGYVLGSLRMYVRTRMKRIFEACLQQAEFILPWELVSEHYCNTLLLVLEWCFCRPQPCGKEQAQEYLYRLLKAQQVIIAKPERAAEKEA